MLLKRLNRGNKLVNKTNNISATDTSNLVKKLTIT